MLGFKGLIAPLCAGALIAAVSTPAAASVVTETYAFSLTNFVDVGTLAVPSPLATITGSFTITFDPDVYVDNATAGLVVNYLNGPSVDSQIGFTNVPAGGGRPDFLAIGGIANDADFIAFGTNDFALTLKFFNPALAQLALCSDGYGCGTAPSTAIASGYTLVGFPDSAWIPVTGAIPEPGAWILMLLGFSVIGASLRRSSGAGAAV